MRRRRFLYGAGAAATAALAGCTTWQMLWPEQGFSARVGVIFSGTRKQDLIGEKDDAEVHRLPATAGYLAPGLTLTQGIHTVAFGIGTRIYKNFKPSIADDLAGKKGGGGLAKYLVMASYSVRF